MVDLQKSGCDSICALCETVAKDHARTFLQLIIGCSYIQIWHSQVISFLAILLPSGCFQGIALLCKTKVCTFVEQILKDSAATILQLLLQLNFASLFDSRYSCNFLGCD